MSSLVRRVKSFSIRKISSTDELKSEPPRPILRRKKTNLVRERSVSMEYVPIHIELEKSDLFLKQKARYEEEEKNDRVEFKRGKLKKRKSVSLDDSGFSKCLEEFNEKCVRVRNREDSIRYRSRYKTVDVLNDLITDFENKPEGSSGNVHKLGNFPVNEEEEDVQIRTTPRNVKSERPRTFASSLTKKQEEPLILRGVTRLEVANDKCFKLCPRETFRLLDHTLERLSPSGTPTPIRHNVTLRKGTKMIGKKELEMIDRDQTIYRLHFDSSKEARFFIEFEKSHHAIPSTAPFKNVGPWYQLKKLLKKRSSRDLLESKGIIKNEPIFGNTLEELCDDEHEVPEVVSRITKLIEEPSNIKSVGLYRASANLAVVQNIRCEINVGRWEILERYRDDVDVLAGTLKLFFRELKEPLISCHVYQKLHRVINDPSRDRSEISKIIDALLPSNRTTLIFVIKHLLKVCEYKEHNKMDFHNISICWGPSLITLPDNCTDLVTQTTEFTKITEDLLSYYSTVFSTNDTSPPSQEPVKVDFVYDILRRITERIEEGIDTEGIYRKSGSSAKIEKIMKQLEKQTLNESDIRNSDIHDLCCVLKKYIANLRRDLVPDEFFHRYCETCDTIEDGALRDQVRQMVANLPRRNVVLLLFQHLQKVVLHERKNKMSYSVLADIWMTTLMAGTSVDNYKKKMPKYSKLFLILLNLNEGLPDLVADSKVRMYSKYDNVPDDIHNEAETLNDKVTKL